MKNNQPLSSNYVRIVYLKEMRPEIKFEDEQQPKAIRNSLAYLSSLIQQDNKKRMAASAKVSMDLTHPEQDELLMSQPNRKKSKEKNTSSAIFQNQQKSKERNAEPRKLILSKIWNENNKNRMPSIEIQKPKSKTMKLELEAMPSRQKQLQQSFIDFCNQLRHENTSQKNKIVFKQRQEPDKIIYTRSRQYVTPEKQKKVRVIHSQTKNNKLFNRRSIVYRKNFKQINNFDWGKIAEGSYDISNLKYI